MVLEKEPFIPRPSPAYNIRNGEPGSVFHAGESEAYLFHYPRRDDVFLSRRPPVRAPGPTGVDGAHAGGRRPHHRMDLESGVSTVYDAGESGRLDSLAVCRGGGGGHTGSRPGLPGAGAKPAVLKGTPLHKTTTCPGGGRSRREQRGCRRRRDARQSERQLRRLPGGHVPVRAPGPLRSSGGGKGVRAGAAGGLRLSDEEFLHRPRQHHGGAGSDEGG